MSESQWSSSNSFSTQVSYIPTTEEAILVGNDTISGDQLGDSVTIDQTGTRVAVGCANKNESGFTRCGAVYIFVRSGTTWTQEAKLTASDKSSSANFGKSISMSGDGTRIVVGAPYANDQDGNAGGGKAYIYLRTGTTWSQEIIPFSGTNRVANKNFGYSVSISSDGYRIAIGAPNYKEGFNSWPGAVHIFFRSGSWVEEAFLLAIDGVENRIYVTAPCANYGDALAVGKVHIYYRSNPNVTHINKQETRLIWNHDATLIASDHSSKDHFGWAISVNKNSTTLAVSAPFARCGRKSRVGKVYIYTRSSLSWTESVVLHSSDEVPNGKFGISMCMNSFGDKLVISAPHADSSNIPEAGKVYIFTNRDYEWTQKSVLTSKDKENTDLFGSSLSIDTYGKHILITSPLANVKSISNSGKAYIYS